MVVNIVDKLHLSVLFDYLFSWNFDRKETTIIVTYLLNYLVTSKKTYKQTISKNRYIQLWLVNYQVTVTCDSRSNVFEVYNINTWMEYARENKYQTGTGIKLIATGQYWIFCNMISVARSNFFFRVMGVTFSYFYECLYVCSIICVNLLLVGDWSKICF